jgi:hypothetical protein
MKVTASRCLARTCIHCALVFSTVVVLAAPVQATAPIQQRTNPVAPAGGPADPLFSVIDLVSSPTTDIGTGSIFESHADASNIGYFCVLTAAHNFPNSTAIGFGDFGTAPNGANSFATTYPIISFQSGGSTGTKDIAVAIVRYGPIDPFWASIRDLKLWAPPAGTDADLKTYTDANVLKFTEVGYGDTGTPHYASGVQDGFSKQTSAGIQRFQNNARSLVTVNAAHGAYTYTDFAWNPGPVSPGNPNLGTGTSFTGDSGGPYFMTDTVTKTINGLTDVFGNAVGPQNVDLYTDTIFGVHTFGNNNDPQLFSDPQRNGGVLLSAGDITWINSVCAVPEPAAMVLALIGLISLVVLKSDRQIFAGHQRSASRSVESPKRSGDFPPMRSIMLKYRLHTGRLL